VCEQVKSHSIVVDENLKNHNLVVRNFRCQILEEGHRWGQRAYNFILRVGPICLFMIEVYVTLYFIAFEQAIEHFFFYYSIAYFLMDLVSSQKNILDSLFIPFYEAYK